MLIQEAIVNMKLSRNSQGQSASFRSNTGVHAFSIAGSNPDID